MEGAYFFGDHLRWNLGWENPNQGGAFICTLIPWLWGLGLTASTRNGRSHVLRAILLAMELFLWFLLCKTYSRGALVACAGAGIFFSLAAIYLRRIPQPGSSKGLAAGDPFTLARLLGLAILLASTGFFERVDPRFVAGDASAGNRLTLWKGGLQMIVVSPWRGWGAGESGPNFAHWFQPLDAGESYAGMVNSYLHLAVERGLPLLTLALAVLTGFVFLALASAVLPPREVTAEGLPRGRHLSFLLLGAAASLLSFLIANVFSTLWIFRNLWWVPAAAATFILISCLSTLRRRSAGIVIKAFALSSLMAIATALALHVAGSAIPHDIKVVRNAAGDLTISKAKASASGGDHGKLAVALPDESVLGESYGKELRRLILAAPQDDLAVLLPRSPGLWKPADARGASRILAFGKRFDEGFAIWKNWPEASLALIHPVGRPRLPEAPDSPPGRVDILLPALDTSGGSRAWKACRKSNPEWKFATSPGVGQDIRQAWPEVLLTLWSM